MHIQTSKSKLLIVLLFSLFVLSSCFKKPVAGKVQVIVETNHAYYECITVPYTIHSVIK